MQLSNEIVFTEGLSLAERPAPGKHDDAGNWMSSSGEGNWQVYDTDNDLIGILTNAAYRVFVTGQVGLGRNGAE